MKTVHWIEAELSRHFEDLDLGRGADLDRDGEIEGPERTDRDGDGEVNSAEWQKFTGDNRAALEKLGGYFKTYYSAGTAFKPDSPIHDLLSIESELASPEEVSTAYEKVEEILRIVKERLSRAELDPQEKLKLVYETIKQVDIELEDQDDVSFVSNISNKVLDCDTSSFVVLAVAHELDWPVYLIEVPNHVFIRWDDGSDRSFNIDRGKIHSDDYYMSNYNLSEDAVVHNSYLSNLSQDGILSRFYENRANGKHSVGRYEEAIEDFYKAIMFGPASAMTYYNLGNTQFELGMYEEAIEDYNKAAKLDPDSAGIYYNRGRANFELGRYEKAIEDYRKASRLNSNILFTYFNYHNIAETKLKQRREASEGSDEVIEPSQNLASVQPPPSCLCNTVGQAGHSSASETSLLSLLKMIIFD